MGFHAPIAAGYKLAGAEAVYRWYQLNFLHAFWLRHWAATEHTTKAAPASYGRAVGAAELLPFTFSRDRPLAHSWKGLRYRAGPGR